MISRLRIQRFKCFEDQEVAFGKLTLLVGGNATGKSTVIQALLLLRQSQQAEAWGARELILNGPLTSVGTAKEALYSKSQEDSIVFSLAGQQETAPITFEFIYPRGKPDAHTLVGNKDFLYPKVNLFVGDVTYLNAERLGPRLLYPMADARREKMNVGIQGEYTAHCLAEFGKETISNLNLAYPGADTLSLLENQTELWMRRIVPEIEIKIERITQVDRVRLGLKNQGVSTDYLRPTNMGFGVSYTLPIIVAALMSKPDSMLIVENPEAHLHPAAQSEMGQFLARTAATGVQVIVETYSDHILNGMRLAVKRKLLQADDVSIQFFIRGEKEAANQVLAPKVDADGRIDLWPEGFFDQIEKDLLELV
ncbi:DUF3696 domain-containing protein [candidate division KSB1 bacterium]|nr:DUF3696 domain-containing protein [candidate division KSB1 bacterium]